MLEQQGFEYLLIDQMGARKGALTHECPIRTGILTLTLTPTQSRILTWVESQIYDAFLGEIETEVCGRFQFEENTEHWLMMNRRKVC